MTDLQWLYVVRFTRLITKMLFRRCTAAGDKTSERHYREYQRFMN